MKCAECAYCWADDSDRFDGFAERMECLMEKLTKENKNKVQVGTVLTDGKGFKLQVVREFKEGRSKLITVKILESPISWSVGKYIYYQGVSHYYGMFME